MYPDLSVCCDGSTWPRVVRMLGVEGFGRWTNSGSSAGSAMINGGGRLALYPPASPLRAYLSSMDAAHSRASGIRRYGNMSIRCLAVGCCPTRM